MCQLFHARPNIGQRFAVDKRPRENTACDIDDGSAGKFWVAVNIHAKNPRQGALFRARERSIAAWAIGAISA